MTEKETYNVEELAEALNLPAWKVKEMIRRDKIDHIHVNETHANVRISKEVKDQLVSGEYWVIRSDREQKRLMKQSDKTICIMVGPIGCNQKLHKNNGKMMCMNVQCSEWMRPVS